MHHFTSEQFLPIQKEEAWTFFSSPSNLATITPPELGFKVLTELKDESIFEGMKIDYTVRPLLGIPLHWQTEITKVQTNKSFIDRQLKGPYKLWEHTHTFIEHNGGVLMLDHVRYELHFGLLGRLVNAMIVKQKIKNIFNYRTVVLNKLFPTYASNTH